MQSKVRQNKINGAIESTLKNISNLIDVNTVVGSPIKVDNGEYIIPISKVTVGILAGGGEYGKLGIFQKGEDHPYSAGNGSIISVKPFLARVFASSITSCGLRLRIGPLA